MLRRLRHSIIPHLQRIPFKLKNPHSDSYTPQSLARVTAGERVAPLRARKKPIEVPIGSLRMRIYPARWKQYRNYTIIWRDAAGEHREKHADLAVAKQRAAVIGTEILNGKTSMLQFSEADRARYLQAVDTLKNTGISLETAVAFYLGHVQKMASSGYPASAIDAAIDFYLQQQPASVAPKTCPEIFAEMIPAREKDGASKNTIDEFKSRLGHFVRDFTGPILSITGQDLNLWLRKLPGTRRTRNNFRGTLVAFYKFAKISGYIPRTWSPLEDVPRVKNEPVRIVIFTPEEIVKIVSETRDNMIPYTAIGAWAGVRHEEMCAPELPVLDWRQIDFEKKEIHVLAEVARKKGYDRIVAMHSNLVAWLEPYAKPNGPICPLRNANNALQKAAKRAGVPWKDNGLRKSFISYELSLVENIGTVATEAGTSPDRIRNNYKKTVPQREASRWFNIWPTAAKQIPLPLRFVK